METVLSTIVSLMRRKFRFAALICFIFVAMLIWNEGLTTLGTAIALVLGFTIALFFVLVWFWGTVLQSFNSRKQP